MTRDPFFVFFLFLFFKPKRQFWVRNSEARFFLFDMIVDSSLRILGMSWGVKLPPVWRPRGVTFGGSGVSIGIDSRESRRLQKDADADELNVFPEEWSCKL